MLDVLFGSTLFKVVVALVALPGPSPFSIIGYALYRWFSSGQSSTPAALGPGPVIKGLEPARSVAGSILVLASEGSPERQRCVDAAVGAVRCLPSDNERIAEYRDILLAEATERELRRSLGLC